MALDLAFNVVASQVNKLVSLDTFVNDISAGLDAEVADGPGGKDNLMKVRQIHCVGLSITGRSWSCARLAAKLNVPRFAYVL